MAFKYQFCNGNHTLSADAVNSADPVCVLVYHGGCQTRFIFLFGLCMNILCQCSVLF